MITRPLDLASKLSPPPRRMEYVFFLNALLLLVFFDLLGSRFVLAPGLAVNFLPAAAGARASAMPVTARLTVRASGQILTTDGLKSMEQLEVWLHAQAKGGAATAGVKPTLLILAEQGVSVGDLTQIISLANQAGFQAPTVVGAEENGEAP